MAYGSNSMAPMKQRSVAKTSPKKTSPKKTSPTPKVPKSAMTDTQKTALKKHMDNHKDLKDLSPSQLKSHRAKMASRLRKGMSMSQAHRDIVKGS